MNRSEAKHLLMLYRPGGSDIADPDMAEALDLARRDEELRHWFEQHCIFQATLRAKFRQIPVPAHLKQSLLAQPKTIRLRGWYRNPAWLATAASLALLIGLAGWWRRPSLPDRFADYQVRMVRTALRAYRMDLATNDMIQVRKFLAANGAPADYAVPKGLDRLQLTGAGFLRWRSNPVAMVCFDRGDKQMLFFFVMNRSAVQDPPPGVPQMAKVSRFMTASWTQDDKTYVLAGPAEADFARKYLQFGGEP